MTPERWRQITASFDAALAHDEAERAAFVACSCGSDAALRREIESMIAAHQNAGRFGETPLFALQTEVEPLLDAQRRAGKFAERPPVDRIGASAAARQPVQGGARFGSYEIAECPGAGGMGEVYRGRDTELGRDVAIKVLPAAFVTDRERLARFEREARVLAALNHPHIGAIYGLESVNDVIFPSLRRSPAAGPVMEPVARFSIAPPSDEAPAVLRDSDTNGRALAVSPDGRYFAYVGGPRLQLYLRAIDQFDSKPVAGTDGADNPFFSPDGQWLGFVADGKLKRISLAGGAPFTICTVITGAFGASWHADGTIIFAPSAPGHVVPGAGLRSRKSSEVIGSWADANQMTL